MWCSVQYRSIKTALHPSQICIRGIPSIPAPSIVTQVKNCRHDPVPLFTTPASRPARLLRSAP
jgi:hypothetical protein